MSDNVEQFPCTEINVCKSAPEGLFLALLRIYFYMLSLATCSQIGVEQCNARNCALRKADTVTLTVVICRPEKR